MYAFPLPLFASVAPLTGLPSVQAIASLARDLILAGVLFSLAIGSTIACCLFSSGLGLHAGMKVAAYFWMLSALLAWWRVTVYLIEEAYGPDGAVTKFFPIFRTPMEKSAPLVMPGLGEPGVKRGVPKMVTEKFDYDHLGGANAYSKSSANGLTDGVATSAPTYQRTTGVDA